jgi:hypothetical protein
MWSIVMLMPFVLRSSQRISFSIVHDRDRYKVNKRQQMTYDMNELSVSRNYLARAFLLEKRRAMIALGKY